MSVSVASEGFWLTSSKKGSPFSFSNMSNPSSWKQELGSVRFVWLWAFCMAGRPEIKVLTIIEADLDIRDL